jgi:hypothetical protein
MRQFPVRQSGAFFLVLTGVCVVVRLSGLLLAQEIEIRMALGATCEYRSAHPEFGNEGVSYRLRT